MRPTSRPLCLGIHAFQVLLLGAALAACGGEDGSSRMQVVAAMPPVGVAQSPTAKAGNVTPPSIANKNKFTITNSEQSKEILKLRALSLLSPLSDREKAGLIVKLRGASPSARLDLINQYPALAAMTDQQKQALLNQIEKIVPVTNPAMLLTCECSDNIQRAICVRESCSNQSEIQSRCNEACGTLAAFRSRCSASRQCETAPAL